ncbi:DNA replication and repair protein RecO [Tenacibaculum adriaticum]|uniref:DNA repair protein RecO n=1 Tax=Tenacibaculum adriaticum TaxID=413713 RepID=A0A5S5DUQ3_9FLAO|nr:DNA repair protein RecO [Tenacibaculum adriaticum]TYP99673.1 DNA replication and repair protein RecO [Tenacibaculum adriaticum]
MAIVSTKAIVLSTIKYGDTSLIVKCFTEQEGVKTYMLRGVLKSKRGKLKPAYFQSLTQLQLTANHNSKNTLNSLREVQVLHPYETIFTSVIKQSIVMFLSEVLSGIIREEEGNHQLYNYLETALIWLDTHDSISNFHLLFLLNLSRFLGFYPDVVQQDAVGFNLLEGAFTNSIHEKLTISGGELVSFKKLLGMNFDAIHKVSFSKKERQTVLKTIIRYFELHLDGFKEPKSLSVLETVFT